jgi:predicted RNase H-like HicB family nuclease
MNRKIRQHDEFIPAAGQEYRCRFRRGEAGGFYVTCPEVPPMIAYGATLPAARAHAIDEIEAWLAALDLSDDIGLRSASLPVYRCPWYSKTYEN